MITPLSPPPPFEHDHQKTELHIEDVKCSKEHQQPRIPAVYPINLILKTPEKHKRTVVKHVRSPRRKEYVLGRTTKVGEQIDIRKTRTIYM